METTSTLQMELFYLGKLTTKNITYRKVNVKYGVHYRCTLLAWDLTIRIAVDRSLGWWGWGLGGVGVRKTTTGCWQRKSAEIVLHRTSE